MTLSNLLGQQSTTPQCSRAGCAQDANVALEWRNPKIHDATRKKTWLACGEHQDYLHEFLRARNFPVAVVPFHSPAGESSSSDT